VFSFPEYYRSVANNYQYLYKEIFEGILPSLTKSLDLKPHHIVADCGSRNGFIAENIF